MFYILLIKFVDQFPVLNVFKYITLRSSLAVITALLISFIFGGRTINYLRSLQGSGQPIRDDGPQTHFSKKGTPTMGGILILFSIFVSTVLWADITNTFILTSLFVLLAFGLLGFADDYLKVAKKNPKGVSGKIKLVWQFLVSFIAAYAITNATDSEVATHLTMPFFKNFALDLGLFYLVFAAVVITGSSNAVNLTDGLDGLAIGTMIIATSCFAFISYIVGNSIFSDYLQIKHIANSGELTVLCAAIVGAGLGFLWYNAPPAQVFMGDVGSLALGGVLGAISVIIKHEIVLAIIGALFVIEAISVMLQVISFKTRGKRIFLMAPIHHHFEKLGWSETKVVIRFWIISFLFAMIGLATLKLR